MNSGKFSAAARFAVQLERAGRHYKLERFTAEANLQSF